MKEWVVIHRIKALHDNGDGLSIRAIEKELGVSRNTIRKYLRMSEGDVLVTKVDTSRRRRKQWDGLHPPSGQVISRHFCHH